MVEQMTDYYDLKFTVFDADDTFRFEGMEIANGDHSCSVPKSAFTGLEGWDLVTKVVSYFTGSGCVSNIILSEIK